MLSVAVPAGGTTTTVASEPWPKALLVSVRSDGKVVSTTLTVVVPAGTGRMKYPLESVTTVWMWPRLQVMSTATPGSGVSPTLKMPLASLSM